MTETEFHHKIKYAILNLKEGNYFTVGDLTFHCRNDNHFLVAGWTVYRHLENLSQKQALKELNKIKDIFKEMVESSQEFAEFVKGKTIEYNLGYDYGMGGRDICCEINGNIKWKMILGQINSG
jgi:hypothetical protein